MNQRLLQLSVICARSASLRRVGHLAFRLPGVGGALRRVSESIISSEQRVWVQIASGTAKGLWLKVLPKWEPGYLRGCAEEGMNEALSRYLRPGGCFYDVGAHIGFYSLLAARLVGQTGAVIAFEPDTDNAEILRQNAARNGLQICVVSAAVSNQDGTIRFQRSTGDGPSRMSGMVIRDNLPAAKESEIVCCPAVSLDGFSSSHRPPTLVKIDVEGAEIQVLEGARSLLETKKPVLIIEVHHQKDLPAVHSILSGLGYALEPLRLEAAKIGARNYLAFVAGLMKSASECG